MIIYYEYDKDYHYDVDDRVDNIWLRATGGGESVLCFGRRFQGSGGSGRGRAPNIRISKLILVSEIAYYFYTFRRTLFKEI